MVKQSWRKQQQQNHQPKQQQQPKQNESRKYLREQPKQQAKQQEPQKSKLEHYQQREQQKEATKNISHPWPKAHQENQPQQKLKSMYSLNEYDVDLILTAISALDLGFVSRAFDLFQHADSSSTANRILFSQFLSQDDKLLIKVQAKNLNILPWTFALMVVEYYNKNKK
jgi:hypothetical protein